MHDLYLDGDAEKIFLEIRIICKLAKKGVY